jgi:hypothetical protein
MKGVKHMKEELLKTQRKPFMPFMESITGGNP